MFFFVIGAIQIYYDDETGNFCAGGNGYWDKIMQTMWRWAKKIHGNGVATEKFMGPWVSSGRYSFHSLNFLSFIRE